MKNIFKTKKIAFLLSIALFSACTDLDEVIKDEVLGTEAADPQGALAAAYSRLGETTFVSVSGVFALQQFTTDEALLPTRGSDWGDGGRWRALHEFTWGSDNPLVTNVWNLLNNGITRSLSAVESINNSPEFPNKRVFLAEARALLAYYLYNTLDMYGQTPYRDPFIEGAPLEIWQSAEGIDRLITEVETVLPDLANMGENSTHNGRFTKQAAYAFLANMYLNRAVFKDRYNPGSNFNFNEPAVDGNGTDMDKVIHYTTLVINSGYFSLESNFFDNFAINNSGASELIFVVVQQIIGVKDGNNDFAYNSMERNQRASANNRGTNASCITPEFYATWDGNHEDPRFHRYYQYDDGTWFMNDGTTTSVPATSIVPNSNLPWFHFNRGLQAGQQYGPTLTSSGDLLMTADGRIQVSQLFMEKAPTVPMVFTPELNFSNPSQAVFAQNEINRGIRVFKFEFDPEKNNSASNSDIPLFRLGGIYTMRAEAYFRKGETGSALNDINTLRVSRTREALFNNAPGAPISNINEDILYNEIAYELYWEMYRRPQMIRFGRYELPFSAKPVSQPFRRVFPIPLSVMDVSSDFTQNQGY